jgi:hypothetical protein
MSDKKIEVGQFVTVQPPSTKTGQPLGISGCKVLEFGETEDGKPAARLDGGIFGEFCALVADLQPEDER